MKTIAILAPMQEELNALVRLLPPVDRAVFHGLEQRDPRSPWTLPRGSEVL
jgi:hypothetical protein